MQKTSIEYLDYTWNPLAMRCTPVSEGCEHCWHLRMADRLAANPSVNELKQQSYAGKLDWFALNEAQLEAPMKRKKPSVIGLQFMGDLFHDRVSFNQIHEIWDIMKACPQHTFLVLTKRPQRMKETLARIYSLERLGWASGFWSHVWLGVSVENQARADERIPILLQIPAAKRWISIEPMMGAVVLGLLNAQRSTLILRRAYHYPGYESTWQRKSDIDWVVLGGETGPGARPMHPDWVRGVRDQCVEAGVPFYFKQWGEFGYANCPGSKRPKRNPDIVLPRASGFISMDCYKIGKKASGHLLDGREWREMPKP